MSPSSELRTPNTPVRDPRPTVVTTLFSSYFFSFIKKELAVAFRVNSNHCPLDLPNIGRLADTSGWWKGVVNHPERSRVIGTTEYLPTCLAACLPTFLYLPRYGIMKSSVCRRCYNEMESPEFLDGDP